MLYYIIVFAAKLYFKIVGRLKNLGKENIPNKGSYIIISNHISNKDPFILASGKLKPLTFIAKESLFRGSLGLLFRFLKAKPINRDGDPRAILNLAVELLRTDHLVGIFPEGTRNKTGKLLGPFKKGPAYIACKAQVPIIPAAVWGTNYGVFHKIVCGYGEPFMPPEGGGKKQIEECNQMMEHRIRQLLESIINKYDKKNKLNS